MYQVNFLRFLLLLLNKFINSLFILYICSIYKLLQTNERMLYKIAFAKDTEFL